MSVLKMMVKARGELVTRDDFLEKIWPEADVTDEVLTRAISILRKEFRKGDAGTTYIQTIPKRGYRLSRSLFDTVKDPVQAAGSYDARSTMNKDAYPWYAQGLAMLKRPFADEAMPTAITYFQEALAKDETSAAVHSALGECYYQMATFSKSGNNREYINLAAQSAKRANQIDPDCGFSYTIVAMQRFLSGDMVGALDLAFKAFDLAPDNADVAMRLGYILAAIGRTTQSIPYFERALSFEPAEGRYLQCLAQAKLCKGDLDEAEALAKKAIDLQYLFAHDTYAAVAYARGDHDLAAKRFEQGCHAMYHLFGEEFGAPDVWRVFPALVHSPDPAVRAGVVQKLAALCSDGATGPSITLMTVIIRTGDAEAFFDVLKDGLLVGSHGILLRLWGGVDTCRAIYTHQDFPDFAKRIGMHAAWEKYGKPDRLA